ncbi:hypothetical protein B0S90_0696 [Caldicellulosiruptor bescii]|jgi:hypothetical protein|uniref:Uncharacterized protein n=2 Tax=Caldicellulosiruptor bescii TaxID=31899 RepID=B9MNM3_CALBD|nr:hypothetical protein [Caldicellulosiruptor bescii]ACM59552.1 hypothetical protein Athe_0420 [Caldicellulosiruptor bescii DSM 6725]PBD04670.1 hypothetical protein B0S85_2349 [Caldicellulosiruptor bescii]PBD05700.1 hypothetical protein B0S90_0696 [Caldicellulosiruptor bescii]PFH15786.1 hypothetical protein B0S88_2291 [Caldicellulosiruptor bescii]PFH17544.1 hypothetical protein B0S93_1404 [Caldicellulosiruptor bescii]
MSRRFKAKDILFRVYIVFIIFITIVAGLIVIPILGGLINVALKALKIEWLWSVAAFGLLGYYVYKFVSKRINNRKPRKEGKQD